MPGANESSTVEWQSAHVMPIDCSPLVLEKNPLTPTTAFSFSSASVVAGSSRSTVPALMPAATSAGRASTSTFRPTDSAVFGLTPGPTPPFALPAIAWCSWRVPPQNASSPNVSKRNVFRPFTIDCAAAATTSSPANAIVPAPPPVPVTFPRPPGPGPPVWLPSHEFAAMNAPPASTPTSNSDPSQPRLFHFLVCIIPVPLPQPQGGG